VYTRGLFSPGEGVGLMGAPSNKMVKRLKGPAAIPFLSWIDMVRVKSLVFVAPLLLAAFEVVIAKTQEHFRDSSGFQDTCTQIENSISGASFVYYSRKT
jgi:hypothetical protein